MIARINTNRETISRTLSRKQLRENEESLVDLADLFENNFNSIETSPARNHPKPEHLPLIDCSYNYKGNYENYVINTLYSIKQIKGTIDHSMFTPPNYTIERLSILLSKKPKKLLILDLDETLIHADFNNQYPIHDKTISFSSEGIQQSVGIFLRSGVFEFLNSLKDQFNICLFTASTRQYADAVLSILDPNNTIFSLRLYRENCLIFDNQLYIKDLSIFNSIVTQDQIVIVDNSLYSFMNNISNGILINSFYNDKSDLELDNVKNYLNQFISTASDVREINENSFAFGQVLMEMS